jgi:hypothetical protein
MQGVLIGALFFVLGVGISASQGLSAEKKYRNIQVLNGVPAKNVESIMRAFNRALGMDCVGCHVKDDWANESKPQFATARKMFQMVKTLNENQLAGVGSVSCWTCHAGQTKPSRLPRPLLDEELAKWPAGLADASKGIKLAMSVYNVTLHVTCNYCHVPTDWKSSAKPTYKMVDRMKSMFSVFPQYMPPTAMTQCWMCHKGSTEPKRRRPF